MEIPNRVLMRKLYLTASQIRLGEVKQMGSGGKVIWTVVMELSRAWNVIVQEFALAFQGLIGTIRMAHERLHPDS